MSIQDSKRIATDTWLAFAKGDVESVLANVSDEVSWLVPGTLKGVSGMMKGKPAVREFVVGVSRIFPAGLQSEIRRTYADGDTVIIELTNRGKLINGGDYENDHCFVFELEGGKVRRVREYADTQKAYDALS